MNIPTRKRKNKHDSVKIVKIIMHGKLRNIFLKYKSSKANPDEVSAYIGLN